MSCINDMLRFKASSRSWNQKGQSGRALALPAGQGARTMGGVGGPAASPGLTADSAALPWGGGHNTGAAHWPGAPEAGQGHRPEGTGAAPHL